MTAPNLIAIVGAGSALSLAGFALMGGAAGAALAHFFPQVHLSIWLLIIGGVMLLLGMTLVGRGGTKTVEKVENELSMPNVVSNFPWTFIGLGVGATLLLVWVLRPRPTKEVTTRTEVQPMYMPPPPLATTAQTFSQPSAPKRTTLTDVLMPLASSAASYATSMGMKALGIPSPTELLGSMVSKFMGSATSKAPAQDQRRRSTAHNGYEAAMRRS